MKKEKDEITFRIKIFSFFIFCFVAICLGKLFYTQIIHKDFYTKEATRQYVTPVSNIFERGTIYFKERNGSLISAATQISGFKIAIVPKDISNIDDVYEKLNNIIEIDKDDFVKKANKKQDPYEEIAFHLTKQKADTISSLKIKGVKIFQEKWRFYPGDSLASNTIGFVAYDGNSLEGRYGLESRYNSELTRNTDNPYINFFAEVFSNISDNFSKNKVKKGDIVTTIEPRVQIFLEKELNEVKTKYNAQSIGAVIINPTDGSIYAISSLPSFNLNDFGKVKNVFTFANPIVENVYEFGSVVKPLVMAAALDANVLNAKTSYTDKGFVFVEKKQIFNFDKKGRGPNTTMQDVLNQSLNTGMVFAYEHLGKQRMRDYMFSFGIKEKTGIDLPNETKGLVNNLNSPRELEYANASFGQGIAMTPIALVRALCSLANGGMLITPHIAKGIKYDDGKEENFVYKTVPTKITKETSEEITRMLVTVMDKSLHNGTLKKEHYSIAVKTGTAQVADNINGGYFKDKHIHSFFGYFPAYDPEFLVFLYAVDPKGTPYASVTWTFPFMNIVDFLINYYELEPDR